ncbi:class IV adenylate cyclase [Entomospira culicis]|uniref:Class IV adenylate cyclase n=1 Tax=Entomospira culicis TaxID=2719989 RepID=A0A968GHA0_9SPIO|nr:class IV adenylate cyclase [Entomospira culicis]NIZ19864.1 class IV adenylate cyclase [Entomospira culicis]NIZ70078.1 class IV adenylate cyclase [Entomospira culicis]WDI37182.1 class IV adenylate cyclase [Entomospira culicis]WDI38811.1 class IV adenylate cyclase [Entomospira culicis]
MAYEVEIKARISAKEYTQMKKQLEQMAVDGGFYERHDVYFKKIGESEERLRLRKCSVKGVLLTYKERHTHEGVETNKEIEMEVSDMAKAQAMLEALHYGVSFEKEKMMHLYTHDGIHYELVEVAGLGLYIEIEKVVEEERDMQGIEQAKVQVREALSRLGVKPEQIEEKSYKKLLGYI